MLHFWDWKSGHNFHTSETVAQPGSLESEKGIYAMKFDLSGSRLITCEARPRYPNPLNPNPNPNLIPNPDPDPDPHH